MRSVVTRRPCAGFFGPPIPRRRTAFFRLRAAVRAAFGATAPTSIVSRCFRCLRYNQYAMAKRKASRKDETAGDFEVISFRVSPALAESSRDACYWARVKFVDFARTALAHEVERLQKAHNGGKPFAKRPT